MEVDPPTPDQQQPYAIVRIKRKRNEEPLDALVVDAAPSRKRTKAGVNVFQYAGTVEQAAWNDEQQKQELEKRLTVLASQKKVAEGAAAVVPPSPVKAPVSPTKPLPTAANARAPKRKMSVASGRTYTIVNNEKDEEPRKRYGNAPPKVWSTKELEEMKRAARFKMYEAVPSTGKGTKLPSETDAEIEKFLPMLKDYLNVSEFVPSAGVDGDTDGADDDYVYDVFYHRPGMIQELYEPGAMSNIAKLTGLPPELSGLSGEDDSDEEYDDEDDEDSNAEDWYTNDYPDEDEFDQDSEEELSDEFHEHSDYDDVVHGRDTGSYRDVMNDDF